MSHFHFASSSLAGAGYKVCFQYFDIERRNRSHVSLTFWWIAQCWKLVGRNMQIRIKYPGSYRRKLFPNFANKPHQQTFCYFRCLPVSWIGYIYYTCDVEHLKMCRGSVTFWDTRDFYIDVLSQLVFGRNLLKFLGSFYLSYPIGDEHFPLCLLNGCFRFVSIR